MTIIIYSIKQNYSKLKMSFKIYSKKKVSQNKLRDLSWSTRTRTLNDCTKNSSVTITPWTSLFAVAALLLSECKFILIFSLRKLFLHFYSKKMKVFFFTLQKIPKNINNQLVSKTNRFERILC
jgi:hypothetical protein